ncbi:hypothetical protein PPERSA_00369 [Pseudocohnilembus persalinus]|uniref:Uncharacterized protein n=1 Tax=Pseudocohnilembus persalinus TaxID=266149 RepID=A0A0V0QXY3_PSEPJ|nr:hypothetical protein PPERSA_00369 [Pseudocohnilembus persalinus]|eukprot:KRX07212.1 hypothetical protein PPERSA_00369 [Pseudocohnilembus persalinus]
MLYQQILSNKKSKFQNFLNLTNSAHIIELEQIEAIKIVNILQNGSRHRKTLHNIEKSNFLYSQLKEASKIPGPGQYLRLFINQLCCQRIFKKAQRKKGQITFSLNKRFIFK